jgi:hypothetical protein
VTWTWASYPSVKIQVACGLLFRNKAQHFVYSYGRCVAKIFIPLHVLALYLLTEEFQNVCVCVCPWFMINEKEGNKSTLLWLTCCDWIYQNCSSFPTVAKTLCWNSALSHTVTTTALEF